MAGPYVKDITVAAFQQDVIDHSTQTPVLLDFWAPWCEPCKTLGPVLEKLAEDYGGGFILGKVDADSEQELAQAFGVQGIPFCVLVKDGRPADGFQGALGEAEIVAFLERHGVVKLSGDDAEDDEPALDPDSPEARLERARVAASAGEVAAVEDALSGIPEEDEAYAVGQRLAAGLSWFADGLGASPGEAAEKLLAARQEFLARDYDAAMASILDSVVADREFQEGLARRAMVLCFVVVGEEDERLDAFRRRLATLLY
jgi:putative thioredoxin